MTRRRQAPAAPGALWTLITGSPEDTEAIGEQLGRLLRPGDVVALDGELGGGKTTLVRGLVRGLGRDPAQVKSPTFVLVREYPPARQAPDAPLIVHVDAYRLQGAAAAMALDLEWLMNPRTITIVEWAERIADALPEARIAMRLDYVQAARRRLSLLPGGRAAAVADALPAAGSASDAADAGGADASAGD